MIRARLTVGERRRREQRAVDAVAAFLILAVLLVWGLGKAGLLSWWWLQ